MYRDKYRIISEIGKSASHRKGITITPIIRELDLSYDQAIKYIDFLLERNLLKAKIKKVDGRDKTFFHTNPQFIDFLYAFTVVDELCKPGRLIVDYDLLDFKSPIALNGNGKKYNEKNKDSRRNWMDWYADIINTFGNGKITVYKVRDVCGHLSMSDNISTSDKQVKRYLKNMRKIGFLEGNKNDLTTTEKGYRFLEFYELMTGLLDLEYHQPDLEIQKKTISSDECTKQPGQMKVEPIIIKEIPNVLPTVDTNILANPLKD